MELTNIKLTNFRSYDELDLKFSSKYNIIYGNNGTGKTNLVEAIYLLALTKSFRVNTDKTMIKKGKKKLIVEGKIKTKVRTSYKVSIDSNSKKTEIDNNNQDKISDYVSNINVILFNPDDVFLIKDSPSERRKLLNIEISKMYKEYLLLLNSYNKILKHRNSYLKEIYINGSASKDYLDILTSKLIEYGFKIYEFRSDFIKNINKYLGSIYKNIFGYGDLTLKYTSDYLKKNKEEIFKSYQKVYSKEMEIGKTLIGIHHDDIVFVLDKNKLKEFGSVGQHKNSIISFKLAEIEVIKDLKGDIPILILDDLFSEIDNEKINNILNILDKNIQTFITTTNIDNFDMNRFDVFKIFKVTEDKVKEEKYGK